MGVHPLPGTVPEGGPKAENCFWFLCPKARGRISCSVIKSRSSRVSGFFIFPLWAMPTRGSNSPDGLPGIPYRCISRTDGSDPVWRPDTPEIVVVRPRFS
jgi:hypothetical protein